MHIHHPTTCVIIPHSTWVAAVEDCGTCFSLGLLVSALRHRGVRVSATDRIIQVDRRRQAVAVWLEDKDE